MPSHSHTVPIGVVTRNRAAMLDVTLRSLLASRLPDKLVIDVLDDASDESSTRGYLRGDWNLRLNGARKIRRQAARFRRQWQIDPRWWRVGRVDGIRTVAGVFNSGGIFNIWPISYPSVGVVNASCRAVQNMFLHHPNAPGVILLQDDVVFTENWYQDLLFHGLHAPDIGIVSGCSHVSNLRSDGRQRLMREAICSAQVLFIHRRAYDKLRWWFEWDHQYQQGFDSMLCYELQSKGTELSVGVIHPAIAQHVGFDSQVFAGRERILKSDRFAKDAVGPIVVAADLNERLPRRLSKSL